MCLFHPFTDVPRISDMVTLGNKTAAPPLVLSKRRFCWGQLSPAAARPPGSPPIVSRRRRSQDSGGTGWLCGRYPETLCLRWYSAEKTQRSDNSEKHQVHLHLQYLTPPRLNFCTQTWLHEVRSTREQTKWSIFSLYIVFNDLMECFKIIFLSESVALKFWECVSHTVSYKVMKSTRCMPAMDEKSW